MKKILAAGFVLAAAMPIAAIADDQAVGTTGAPVLPKTEASTTGNGSTLPKTESSDDGNGPAAVKNVGYRGPLYDVGRRLNDAGFFPILVFGETYLDNLSMGFIRHSDQIGTFFVYGFDLNLGATTPLKGTSLHFTDSVTRRTNTAFFAQSGDEIVAGAASNLPRDNHLTRATIEQEFADGRFFVEGGKGYANDYFARPVCNNAYLCMSVIDGTHKLAGINFPNYSNWFVRAGIKPDDNLRLQVAQFEYSTNSAGFGTSENGFERWESTYRPAWFADAQYADTKTRMPYSYEFMYFYNKIPQADSILGSTANPTPTRRQSGIFASTVQTLWRPETGGMLQAFAAGTRSFNERQTQTPTTAGLKYAFDAGLTMKAPFASRPFDSYSIQYTRVGLTRDEQTFLANRGYGNGSAENAMGISSNLRLFDYVFFQPYAQYLWNVQANNYVSLAGLNRFVPAAPAIPTGRTGKSGWAAGVVFVIALDRLSGLTTRPSGYDGHYP